MSRETFTAIFSLTEAQPWLKEAQTALFDLIDECSNEEQQALICNLLHRFLFLDHRGFEAAAQTIADHVEIALGLKPEETYICALDDGNYSDSAQMLAYVMKCVKWKSKAWGTTSFVARRSSILEIEARPNIVLVDEFVGTGETASKAIRKFKDSLEEKGIVAKIHFAAIAGMEKSRARVSQEVNNPFYVHCLTRGISDCPEADEVGARIAAMTELEKCLAAEGRRGKLSRHHLGYKKSEALYSRAGGNTPNNVFPIFWWEAYADNSERATLLKCV